MIGRGRRDFDDFAAQAFDQRAILGFGVNDDNVIVCGQCDLRDLSLGCKGFTGTGDAKDNLLHLQYSPHSGRCSSAGRLPERGAFPAPAAYSSSRSCV